MVEELPLSLVAKMLIHAKKKETEQQIYPLWLVHVFMASQKGEEIIPIEKMFESESKTKTTTRTNEEIIAEFVKIVEQDKKKRGGD